jgi:site-specific DNA-methyltransferase (adenine-specific)
MNQKSETHNIDCLEFMRSLPDKAFSLAICDPPYGIGEDGSKNKSRSVHAISQNYKSFAGQDIEPPNTEYFTELLRISRNQIIFGANHFIERLNINSSCWIVWDKDNGATDFADCELAWSSFSSAVRRFRFRWQGMLQQDMKNKETRIHPTQKPVALYKWLLQNYAKQGDTIFDSHLGSQSSRIAAWDLGFDFVGCELDKDYFNAGNERFENHKKQPNLFFNATTNPVQDSLFLGEIK